MINLPNKRIFVKNHQKNEDKGMLLNFSLENYRSFKERQYFSMEANATEAKPSNAVTLHLDSGEQLRLVKSAAIFGANASGKSNLIRAFYSLRRLLTAASDIEVTKPLSQYAPFLFDKRSAQAEVSFDLQFLHPDDKGLMQKFRYQLVFNAEGIHQEILSYYPKKREQNIFERPFEQKPEEELHKARLGKSFNYKTYELHKKIPFLSIFRKAENYHPLLSKVYAYFETWDIWNLSQTARVGLLRNTMLTELKKQENAAIQDKINRLIRAADTKIKTLKIADIDTRKIDFLERISDENIKEQLSQQLKHELYGVHEVFDSEGKVLDLHDLPFSEESTGTNALVALAYLIFKVLEQGGLLIFDELDTSLHPHISRILVQLFHAPELNPRHAQLIYTTHEVNILDRQMLRTDQVWFAEKDERGRTELYAMQDFEDLRSDTAFDKWYLAGRFGAVPQTPQDIVHSLLGNGKED